MPETEINTTGNEIKKRGQIIGGTLLILSTITAIFFLFAFWPNKIPDMNSNVSGTYQFKLFAIHLIEENKPVANVPNPNAGATSSQRNKTTDSLDSIAKIKKAKDTNNKSGLDTSRQVKPSENKKADIETIDLNMIFLILVAISGFLGNMIHISTSFTTFIGNETFKRSWILWYIAKPFTASALAVIVYFILRAGFFSYGTDPRSLSLYGILSMSALAGLFTDTATLKLKEIFEVIFKPKDERDDKLDAFKIDGIIPEKLNKGDNKVSVKGSGFQRKNLSVLVDGKQVPNIVTSNNSMDFVYTVADPVTSGTIVTFQVFDELKKEIFKKQLTIQ